MYNNNKKKYSKCVALFYVSDKVDKMHHINAHLLTNQHWSKPFIFQAAI